MSVSEAKKIRSPKVVEVVARVEAAAETTATKGESDTARIRRIRKRRESGGQLKEIPYWWIVLVGGVLGALFYWGLITLLSRPSSAKQTHRMEFWGVDKPEFLSVQPRVLDVPLKREPRSDLPAIWSLDFQRIVRPAAPWESMTEIGFYPFYYSHGLERVESPQSVQIRSADFFSADGIVRFGLQKPVRLEPGELLSLSRLTPERFGAVTNRGSFPIGWTLRLEVEAPGMLTLRSHVVSARAWKDIERNPIGLVVSQATEKHRSLDRLNEYFEWCFPLGRIVTPSNGAETVSRLALLSFLWNASEITLRNVTAMIAGLFGIGTLGLAWALKRSATGMASAIRWAVAGGLVWFSLGFVQLMVTPPFHGSDEPTHFISYAVWSHDPAAIDQTWSWGKRNHFARMWMRPDQVFSATDRQQSLGDFLDRPGVMESQPEARSSTQTRLWQLVQPILAPFFIEEKLFGLRLVSLMVSTIGFFGLVGFVAGSRRRSPATPFAALILLGVPALSFFGMNLANYPVLFFGGLMFLGALMSVFDLEQMGSRSGIVSAAALGCGVSLILMTSQSALPMAVWLGAVLAVIPLRTLFPVAPDANSPAPRELETLGDLLKFWTSFGIGLLLPMSLLTPEYAHRILSTLKLSNLGQASTLGHSLAFMSLAAVSTLVLGGLHAVLSVVRDSIRPAGFKGLGRLSRAGRVIAISIVAAWAVSGVLPRNDVGGLRELVPVWDFPTHTGLGRPILDDPMLGELPPSRNQYVVQSTLSWLRSLGWGYPDFMVSQLFWGNLGYIDTVLPSVWSRLYGTAVVFGWALLFWRLSRVRQSEKLLLAAVWMVGLILTVAALAWACRHSPATPSLHGRYLILVYLGGLLLAGWGWEPWVTRLFLRWPRLGLIGISLLVIGIHWVAVGTQLRRYFG